MTFDDIAGIASELTGRDIRRVVMDDDDVGGRAGRARHARRSWRGSLLGIFQAAREGRFAGTDPLLGDLLGREPRTVRDLLADRVAA